MDLQTTLALSDIFEQVRKDAYWECLSDDETVYIECPTVEQVADVWRWMKRGGRGSPPHGDEGWAVERILSWRRPELELLDPSPPAIAS